MKHNSVIIALLAGSLCSAAGSVSAATIDLNVPTTTSLTNSSQVFTARLRYETTNGADQLLYPQSNPSGYAGADVLRANSPYVGSASYDFSLSHTAATGNYVFVLSNGTRTGDVSLVSTSSTLNLNPGVGALTYNVLHIYAVGNRKNTLTMSYSDLNFVTGDGLTTAGTLQTSASIGSVRGGSIDQWLVASPSTNLDSFDWTLSGKATMKSTFAPGTPPSDLLKLEISGRQVAVIPEPAVAGLLAPASVLLLRRRR